ncbi:ATP-binding protein [Streptomyces sp. NPDC002994]|uniref:ATP-binding protein n=1 Tax=Streptomyces sp. NPDC002994 TaxID=3154441 RepID=UPI0033A2C2DD
MRVIVSVEPRFGPGRIQAAAPEGAAGGARAVMRQHLASWGLESVAEDVLLIVTELLSNAVRYGTSPWGARMCLVLDEHGRRYVRLEVDDSGVGINVDRIRAHWRHPSGSLMDGGRGLFIVDTLASRWGDDHSGRGHTVWAELDVTPDPAGAG